MAISLSITRSFSHVLRETDSKEIASNAIENIARAELNASAKSSVFQKAKKVGCSIHFIENSKKSSADFFSSSAHLMLNDLTTKIFILHKNLLRAFGLDANLTPLKESIKRMWKVCS